jgi:nucleotide-binding universal stress UspA family protein
VFGTVLVGYDGSDSARDAVALGEALAEPMSGELVLARVFPWKPGSAAPAEREERAVRELREAAIAVSGRAEAVPNDDVAKGLEDIAVELGADLVVIGSSSRGRPHSALPGHVGLSLLHGSPCPVAVAPTRFRHRYAAAIRTIVIGYDGSKESGAALPLVGELARLLHARLRVIVVEADGFEDGKPERRLTEALAALPPGVERAGTLLSGEPAPALLAEAAHDADLLVVGSRRQGPLRRALLGSVSSVLVREAPCPVLVFPRGARTAAPEVRGTAAAG